jgi:hypothetical protein
MKIMKITLSGLLFLWIANLALAQNEERTSPVFPGCNENVRNDFKQSEKCINTNLNNQLLIYLDDFAEKMMDGGISKAEAVIEYTIDKNGRITNIQIMEGSNPELGKKVKFALQKIANSMIKNGKVVEPARLADGTPVDLIMKLPVKFQIQ